jgi:O-antigen/teichoic acid export membrane protein
MSHRRKILHGSASNTARILLSMVVALVLPPLLVHRLHPAEYAAWVLILQCSGYISLLDLGLQTAVGKFVAEYDATGDHRAAGQILSSSFVLLSVSALIGAIGIGIISWCVPLLFHQMPVELIGEVRIGILVVGLSTVIGLPFGAFVGAFTGLQRYGFPTLLAMASKLLSSATLATLLFLHGTLVNLAWVLALFNVVTAVAQFAGWKMYASDRVDFSWKLAHRDIARRLLKYGAVLAIWSVAMLLISGLDVVIVGHYDYKNAGYYGIAASVTNTMLVLLGGMFSPLMPAVASLQAARTGEEIGEITIKATRLCVLLLCVFGMPLVFGAYPLLKLWVGHAYAVSSMGFLQALVVGNAIRQFGYPYSLVVLATGKQHLATLAGIVEALVNICVSIYLVQRIGAIGVAIGTLVGAVVSIAMHLAVSMRYTRSAIAMPRRKFVVQGILRPLSCAIPALLLLPLWNRFGMAPWGVAWWLACSFGTLIIAWQVGLDDPDRARIAAALSRLSAGRYAGAS